MKTPTSIPRLKAAVLAVSSVMICSVAGAVHAQYGGSASGQGSSAGQGSSCGSNSWSLWSAKAEGSSRVRASGQLWRLQQRLFGTGEAEGLFWRGRVWGSRQGSGIRKGGSEDQGRA